MLFGHVARLDATTPAHQILKQVIAVKSGYQSDAVWRRAPGRPRNSWIMQIGNGSPLSIRWEWKKAQDHGHHGESSQVATDLSCLRVMMMMMSSQDRISNMPYLTTLTGAGLNVQNVEVPTSGHVI